MTVYQICYWNNLIDDYVPVTGFPLYKTTEQGEKVIDYLKLHPQNNCSFALHERYVMESE